MLLCTITVPAFNNDHTMDNSILNLDDHYSFDSARYANIQRWLRGIIEVAQEPTLRSPILIQDQRPCPPISRKKRCTPTTNISSSPIDDGHSVSGSRNISLTVSARRRSRTAATSRQAPWGLPATRRFFDKRNWMDEADQNLLSSTSDSASSSPWRDAYTVMHISHSVTKPRRSSRRKLSVSLTPSSPSPSSITPIIIPVCPPLTAGSPHTPVRPRHQQQFPRHDFLVPDIQTPALTACSARSQSLDDDTLSTVSSFHDMPETPFDAPMLPQYDDSLEDRL